METMKFTTLSDGKYVEPCCTLFVPQRPAEVQNIAPLIYNARSVEPIELLPALHASVFEEPPGCVVLCKSRAL